MREGKATAGEEEVCSSRVSSMGSTVAACLAEETEMHSVSGHILVHSKESWTGSIWFNPPRSFK